MGTPPTSHCSVDSAHIREQGYLCEFDGKVRRFNHLVFEDLGTLRRVEQRVDVEVTKVDKGRSWGH